MIVLVRALPLTLIWAAVTGSLSTANLGLGFLLSVLALFVVRERLGGGLSRFRVLKVLALVVLFVKELALSAWTVAVLVTRRRLELKPGIFAFPLTVTGDFEIALLANLITLTPGTLSVDVSHDRACLYVHAIDCSDPQAARRRIAEGFERRILEAFG